MVSDFVCAACNADLAASSNDLAKYIFATSIKDSQAPWTFDIKKLVKCCVEIATPDGRLIPFCASNNVGYREGVREEMQR